MLKIAVILAQVQGPPCIPAAAMKRLLDDNQLRQSFVLEDGDQDRWFVIEHPNDGSALLGYFQKSTGAFCVATTRAPRKGA